jgi:hypothetical protein
MVEHTGLISRIRKAEARVKVLHALLERETGVTELEGLLLAQISSMGWTDHVELHSLKKGWGWTRSGLAVNGLKRKMYIDYPRDGPTRFRINKFGREALKRFHEQLSEA